MTVDVLMSYPTEADALSDPALAASGYISVTDTQWIDGVDGEGNPTRTPVYSYGWNLGCCFPGLTLVLVPAAYDAEGNQTQAQQNFPGFWALISHKGDTPDPALTAIEPCRMAAHREWAAAGQPFVFQTGLRADPAQIATINRIDGLPAGSAYPISSPVVIE